MNNNKKIKVGDLVRSVHRNWERRGYGIITKITEASDVDINNGYGYPYVTLVWQSTLETDSCSSTRLELVNSK
jgi:hypothetical protein